VLQAAALDPEAAYVWADAAEIGLTAGRSDEALDAAERALSLDPERIHCLEAAAAVYGDRADWEQFERVVRAVLGVDPGNVTALCRLAYVHEHRGELDAAIVCLQQALERAPGSKDALGVLRDLLVETERYDEAIDVSERILELVPDDSRSWSGLAHVYLAQHRFEQCVSAADNAIDCDSTNEFGYRLRGIALWGLGREDDALESMRLSAHHAPGNPAPERPWAERAHMAGRASRFEDADLYLEEARRIHESGIVHEVDSWLAAIHGDATRAERAAAAAAALDPTHRHSHMATGYAALAVDDWVTARSAFTAAKAIAPGCCAETGVALARIGMADPTIDLAAAREKIERKNMNCRCQFYRRLSAAS
jgi:tetratricopeptide (TPR) repeat protein